MKKLPVFFLNRARLGLLFILSLLSGWAHGTTRYVTTTGSDSNPCTLAQPCATPTHAAAISSAGDVVNVGSGTYSYGASAAIFATAGSSGNPITITCTTRGSCKITNAVGPGNATVVDMKAQFNVLDGFEITNTNPSGNNLGVFVEASNVSLTRNTIHDIRTDCSSSGGGGIQVYTNNYTNIVLDSNQVYNINWASGAPTCPNSVVQSDGIISEQTGFTTSTVISNNLIYNVSGGWCISTSTNAQVINNTMFNCVNGGIVFNNAPAGALASNNIIVYTGLPASNGLRYSGACAIQNGTASTTTYGFNELAGNRDGSGTTHANYGTGFGCNTSTTNPGDILVDPAGGTVFVNWQQNGSGDYHQKAGSPTIAAATATGAPNHDYDGTTRPSGAGYDIGAYQSGVTWYVRADGGTRYSANVTSGQCDGLADVAYPGSGTNQHCAFNDFRYLWDDDSGLIGLGAWVIAGGDTVVVRGCHALATQQNPANPSCRIGWDINSGGGPNNQWCTNVGPYGCTNPPIPSGTAGAHTRIIGGCVLSGNCNTGNTTNRANLTQIFGGFGLQFTLNFSSTSYVDFQGFELTTHNGACSHHGAPAYPRGCATSQPLDDYADNGIHTNNATANVLFQDVYIDGFESNGTFGPIGGPITWNRANISFNMQSGMQFDDGSSTPDAAGSQLIMTYVTGKGNGCKQEYPRVHAWPALACWDDVSGGFGDFISGQNTTLDVLTCDHCDIEYNTKDAFIGPHTQVKTLTVTNSVSIGNMGAQMKNGSALNGTTLFQNNLFVMNCFRQRETLPGAAQNFYNTTGLPGSYLSDYCRAGGDGWSFMIRANSSNHYYGNTVVAANATMLDMNCGYQDGSGVHEETNCGTAPLIWRDNNIIGFTPPENGGQAPGLWYFDPGAGGSLVLTADHNNYYSVRNITPDICGTNNITCVNPLLTSQPSQTWVSEATLDAFNPFAGTGNSFYPTGSSPLLAAGTTLAGLTTDFFGTSRPSPPAMGGAQLAGTATVATPTASPVAGTYTSTQSVALSTATGGATICYTTNGTTPAATVVGTCDGGSTTYSGAISVSVTTTIKAIGTLVGDLNSGVFSGLYTITPPVVSPVGISGSTVKMSGSFTIIQ